MNNFINIPHIDKKQKQKYFKNGQNKFKAASKKLNVSHKKHTKLTWKSQLLHTSKKPKCN